MGLTNAILSVNHLLTLYTDDTLTQKLIKAYNKAYKGLMADEENLMGWRDFKEYKKALQNVKNEFDDLLIHKYDINPSELKALSESVKSNIRLSILK